VTDRSARREVRLKVYGIGTPEAGRRVVAAPSQAVAARALGIAARTLREFGSVTANDAEIAAAMSRPGVVFATRDNRHNRRRIDTDYKAET